MSFEVIPSNYNYDCPKCNKKIDTICDNDCGTFICSECGEFYYQDEQYIFEHHPYCGINSDDDLSDLE